MVLQARHCVGLSMVVVVVGAEVGESVGADVGLSVVTGVDVPRQDVGMTAHATGPPSTPCTTTVFPDATAGSTGNIIAPTASLFTGVYK